MFLYFVTFGGRWGKPQRARKKEGKEITIEKGFLYLLLLPSHPFKISCLEQKENQGMFCSHWPRTALETTLITPFC